MKNQKTISITILVLLLIVSAFGDIPAGYYDAAAGKTGSQLKTALYNIIKGHTTYPYTSSSTDVWDILKNTDKDTNNTNNVILLYTGWSINGPNEYNNGNGWNREHVWAKSHGNFSETPPAGTDAHHLRPTDITVNSARGNKDFDNGGTQYIDGDGATGCYTDNDSWEPRNAVKGDIARMLFYMATRYEGENNEPQLELVDQVNTEAISSDGVGYFGKLSTLLEWHEQDPVDNFERNRNEVIYSYQHNRNPFIDHPEYVNLIWGDNPPPSAPSQLTATDISYTTVTLTWTDNSTDESGFRVYQNDSLISITNINTTVYTVEGLTSGNSYTFGVTAWSAYGESTAATLQIATLSEDTTNRVIFFSEYIEGSSNNKALEIVNGSTIAVNLDDFAIISNTNNDPWLATNYKFPSGTILNPGQVWVIAYSSADQSILGVANDVVSSTVMNFNGDDVRALVKISGTDTIFLDIIGAYRDSTYSTSGWPVAGVSGATKDHTLVRKPEIRCGNAIWATSSGTNTDDSEWIVYDQNTFTYLGTHSFSDKIIVPGPSFDGPDYFQLYPAYPSPFNNTTHLAFDMPISSAVILTIFDLHGNQISEKCLGPLSAGRHDFEWNGKSYVSGLYFYRVQVGEQARAGKFLLLK